MNFPDQEVESHSAVIRDPELREIADRIGRNLEANAELKRTFVPSAQLPLWPESARGVPNDILRSALFAAIQGKGRVYFRHKLLASYDGVQIRYTGEQLDQSDLDVWEQAIHLARLEPLGTACYFTAHGFLRAIKRHAGKSDYLWLQSVITRLQACVVEITRHRKIYGRSLVTRFDIDDVTRRFRVAIDPDMLLVYTAGWTSVAWEQRQQLRGKPLALWLHGYYASHAKPVPVKVDTLRSLCGSKDKTLRRRCSKGVDPVLDCDPKLIAIDEEADHGVFCPKRRLNNAPQQPGGLLDVISCGFPRAVLLLPKSHCLNRSLLVLEARVELHDDITPVWCTWN